MRKWRVLLWSHKTGEPKQIDIITVGNTYSPSQFRLDHEAWGCSMCDGTLMFDNAKDNLMWIEGHKEPVKIF